MRTLKIAAFQSPEDLYLIRIGADDLVFVRAINTFDANRESKVDDVLKMYLKHLVEIGTELLSMVAVSVIALVLSAFVWFKNPETHWMAAAILVAALAVPLCSGIPAYRRIAQTEISYAAYGTQNPSMSAIA